MNIYILPSATVQEPEERNGRGKFTVVFLSEEKSDVIENFRCTNCGWVVFQYSNKEIQSIVYGIAAPEEMNHLDAMCSRCKRIFRVV